MSMRWYRSNPVRIEPLGDSLVAYHTLRGDTHVLQPLAGALLEELEFPASATQLIERLDLPHLNVDTINSCLGELERYDLVYRSAA